MNLVEHLDNAEAALQERFRAIEATLRQNLARVLEAFRAQQVGSHHFAGVSGYGHDDLGRQVLDRVFAQIMGCEAAAVRVQMVSGTHAIACALFGVLRPGDELLAITGPPYDTLEEVIGLRGSGQGSLREFGITYRQLDLLEGSVDWQSLKTALKPQTRLVHIQRSCGYDWRPSFSIAQIAEMIQLVKAQNPEVVVFVDNCYGEFVEAQEPTHVGADLIAGSLIKNPGGTIVPAGGYVAGRAEWVEQATCRLTAPGIGSEGGATLDLNRILFQGVFLAPQMVAEAVKIAHLAAQVFQDLGYPVSPLPQTPRTDIIQAIQLGSPQKLAAFCRAIQRSSPIEAYLTPIPEVMPGYADPVVMAAGTFIAGSSAELSADGPMRDPYTVYLQGGTHLCHGRLALEAVLTAWEAL
ncbi:methionine gamma-lyase family protein [Synechococcus sp. Nb3U1]|uniref:methionine gamma-lyase family protein n=1 Tax=Synechococcus sp. Nb3U1 TaxID=1914529 RepID=UPI001F48D3C9|nr:methionine gamma-lyase family protein [Synechococcus sp. Nb3U1]MCF2971543.1 methionine gamma-lyase family protein [Synechococcus sp. Nb3U1]